MAIELNTQSVGNRKIDGQGLQTADSQSSGLQAATTTPILSGESLKVTSGAMTDLEKLVARLKSESDDARMSVAQRRIAILQTVLASMADSISTTQAKNLVDLETKLGELDEAKAELDSLTSQKAAAEGRSALLDAMIKALEDAIENEKQNGEDHRERIEELKAQKAEEDKKILELSNAISAAATKIAGLDAEISNLSSLIGAVTLNQVAAAVRAAASEVDAAEEHETNAERETEEKKAEATNPVNVIRESLDKIDEDIRRTLDENQVVKA